MFILLWGDVYSAQHRAARSLRISNCMLSTWTQQNQILNADIKSTVPKTMSSLLLLLFNRSLSPQVFSAYCISCILQGTSHKLFDPCKSSMTRLQHQFRFTAEKMRQRKVLSKTTEQITSGSARICTVILWQNWCQCNLVLRVNSVRIG